MTKKPMTPDEATSLFTSATTKGVISPQTSSLITGNLGNLVLAGAAGKDLEDITASDVTLVTVLIDSSSSIADRGLEKAVREGQNALLDAFAGAKDQDAVLLACWTFSGTMDVIHSYVPVPDATRLDTRNYRASGSTALYDAWCSALAANVAYAQRLRDGGTPTRSVVVVVTDGEDVGSKRTTAECARLSRDHNDSNVLCIGERVVGSGLGWDIVAAWVAAPASAEERHAKRRAKIEL